MAAPADSKCDKCFSPIPAGAAICPDCGAPVKDASRADAEAAVYPELAKANLARMRGDYKQAEDQLLSVLKRYPNNPSANEMLGDLAAERDDWPHAVEWYEMALEIVPTSASIARKIKDAREKINRQDTQTTTAQLGLPDPSSKMPLLVAGGIILLMAAFAGVFYLGTRQRTPVADNTPPRVISAQQPASKPSDTSEPSGVSETPELPMTAEEQSIMDVLKAKGDDGKSVLAVATDPRNGSVRITYSAPAAEMRATAARLAREAFATQTGFNLVTLRGVTNGVVAYMADVERTRMMESQDPVWQQAQSSPDAWINHVLTNEWPAGTAPPTTNTQPDSQTPAEPTPGSTAGTTPPGGQ